MPPLNITERIRETCQHFLDYMSTLSAEDLIICESKDILREKYITWRTNTNNRGGFTDIINCLKRDKNLVICAVNGKPYYIVSKNAEYIRTRKMQLQALDWRRNVENSKGGIEISNFPTDSFMAEDGQGFNRSITLINNGKIERRLISIEAIGIGYDRLKVSLSDQLPLIIKPSEKKEFLIDFQPTSSGAYNICVIFKFYSFCIGRFLNFQTCSSDLGDILKQTTPYIRKKKKVLISKDIDHVVDGQKIENKRKKESNLFYKKPPNYKIPTDVKESAMLGEVTEKYEFESNLLNEDNYTKNFHELLWVEELKLKNNMLDYSLEGVQMTCRKGVNGLLALEVPGLSENRPSVLIGDSILVTATGIGKILYRGYIHAIEKERILLKFSKNFHFMFSPDSKWDVEFEFNRSIINIQHHGIESCIKLLADPTGKKYLFPIPTPRSTADKYEGVKFDPFNKNLNRLQSTAVSSILAGSYSTCPYIIFGPPGTGKTTTLIEAVKQYGLLPSTNRILICAPHNNAADLLLRQLASTIPPSEMFRYNSYLRQKCEVDEITLRYSYYDTVSDAFGIKSYEILKGFKYIVCTCVMASKLGQQMLGRDPVFNKNDFSAVFIDECGHGVEPEIVATFSGFFTTSDGKSSKFESKTSNRLIIAGDPKQLGPIVFSSTAEKGGLALSFIERLVTTASPYAIDYEAFPSTCGYNPVYITKLTDCYRCHPDILKIPNELFYNKELIAKADPTVSHSLLNWAELPNKQFPLIFHGVEGKQDQEGNSPSWFNISEIERVLYYVQLLVDTRKCDSDAIGVITPYRKQVNKIKLALKKKSTTQNNYEGVLVGSCEQLQGQERKVIIVSTVRSSLDFMSQDRYFNLGFLSNPKRFNVAITRSQALLIIIGNPTVLSKDKCFGKLLSFCSEQGAYLGPSYKPADDDSSDGFVLVEPSEDETIPFDNISRITTILQSRFSISVEDETSNEEGISPQHVSEFIGGTV